MNGQLGRLPKGSFPEPSALPFPEPDVGGADFRCVRTL